jgi:hypothetical protein
LVQEFGAAAGAGVDQELFGCCGAGEAADGVAGQAEDAGDGPQVMALGAQVVHGGVPLADPVGERPGPQPDRSIKELLKVGAPWRGGES